MEKKYTPGPWRSDAVKDSNGCVVAWDIWGGVDTSIACFVRNPANAALIAAAPDLLAALEEIQITGGECVNFLHNNHSLIARHEGQQYADKVWQAINKCAETGAKIKAAIAKAKGAK